MGLDENNYWNRRTVDRRRVLRGGMLIGTAFAGAALIGCSDPDETDTDDRTSSAPGASATTGAAPATNAGGPRYGGRFRVPEFTVQSTFDVYRAGGGTHLFAGLTSNRLVQLDPVTLELRPGLLASWEEIEPGLEWVLHVQPEAVWEDKAPTNGRPYDAEDALHNFLYPGGYLYDEGYQREVWYQGIDVAATEVIDEKTMRLRMTQPNATILAATADHRQQNIPKEMPSEFDFSNYPNIPAVGAWVVKEWTEGEYALLQRNPNYWEKDAQGNAFPYFDEYEVQWYGDDSSGYSALLTDQIDYLPVSAARAAEAEGEDDLVVWRFEFRSDGIQALNAKRFPDSRLWKAFHRLIDYQDIGENVYDGYYSYTALVSGTFPHVMKSDEVQQLPGFNPDTRDADVAEAMKLLDAAGYPNGAGLSIHNISSAGPGQPNYDWAIRTQATLSELAPDMDFQTAPATDGPSFQRRLLEGEYDSITHQILEGPDVRLALQAYLTGSSRNWSFYSNPEVDDLITQSMAQSGDELGDTISKIEQAVLETGSPLYRLGQWQQAASRTRVHGPELLEGRSMGGAGNDATILPRYWWFEES